MNRGKLTQQIERIEINWDLGLEGISLFASSLENTPQGDPSDGCFCKRNSSNTLNGF